MARSNLQLKDRQRLALFAVVAALALPVLYWFAVVGFSNPATRLRKDIESQARRAMIGRAPITFVHRPVNQWTRPVRDFYLRIERNGGIFLSYGKHEEGHYQARLTEPAGAGGRFEFRNIGEAIEIELIPAGETADVASVRPLP